MRGATRHDRSGTEEYRSGHQADSASPGGFDIVSDNMLDFTSKMET